jgi:8-oxo-dGTP diphosphatase
MKPPQESPDFPDAFYRVSTKGLCVHDGKILMAKDVTPGRYADAGGLWELPGGGLDFGENCQEALVREIQEEMGLTVTSIAPNPTYFWTYKRLNIRGMPWHYVFVLCFRFEVADLNFTPTVECQDIKFFSKDELMSALVGDQMEPLKQIFNPADFA